MFANKGDMWKIPIKAGFGFRSCITKCSIRQVNLKEGGSDGWNIESIMTLLYTGKYEILTANFHVNRWIDKNDGHQPEYILTKV